MHSPGMRSTLRTVRSPFRAVGFALVCAVAFTPSASADEVNCAAEPPAPTAPALDRLVDRLDAIARAAHDGQAAAGDDGTGSASATPSTGGPADAEAGAGDTAPTTAVVLPGDLIGAEAETGAGESAGPAADVTAGAPGSTESQLPSSGPGGPADVVGAGGEVPPPTTIVSPDDALVPDTGAGEAGAPGGPAVSSLVPVRPGGAGDAGGPTIEAPAGTIPPPPGVQTLLPVERPPIGPSVGSGAAPGATAAGPEGGALPPPVQVEAIPILWTKKPGEAWTPEERAAVQRVWDTLPGNLTPGLQEMQRGGVKGANPASYSGRHTRVIVWDGFFEDGLKDKYVYGDKIIEVVVFHEIAHHWAHTNSGRIRDYARMFWNPPAAGPGGRLRTWTPKPGAGFVKRRRPAGVAEPANAYMGKNPHEDFGVGMEMYRYDPARLRSTPAGRRRYDWIKKNIFGGREYPPPAPPAAAAAAVAAP